jgi:hypothetical protein
MPVIVIGGSGRGVGKTALVCGIVAALPEFGWTAAKITGHEHGCPAPVWEETTPGQGSGTARFLAAGASRAFLVTAGESDLAQRLAQLQALVGSGAHLILESNSILAYVRPDLCLGVLGAAEVAVKPSFTPFLSRVEAFVASARLSPKPFNPDPARPLFLLPDLEHVSVPMLAWLRAALRS